jgi:NAD-dependent dihydropyrimidine dehydrogenase PreA subunit
MSKMDSYAVLMESLGFPESSSLRALLEYLITPRQADLAAAMPGNPDELADKLGMDRAAAMNDIYDMYRRGIIFPKNRYTMEKCRFARTVGEFHDAVGSRLSLDPHTDPTLYRLIWDFRRSDMDRDMAEKSAKFEAPIIRVLPPYKLVKDHPELLPSENLENLIAAQTRIAEAGCTCRKTKNVLGEACSTTTDGHCIVFGRAADNCITRGTAREISQEEAMDFFLKMEEDGVIHNWLNYAGTDLFIMCNCCPCCCIAIHPLREHNVPYSKWWAPSRWEAEVDSEECIGCEQCLDFCGFEAIEMRNGDGDEKAHVMPEKCLGCGACVIRCPNGSINFNLVRPPEHIPQELPQTFH